MKFGKLSDLSKVDFSLPADPVGTNQFLTTLETSESPTLFIGCTGWSMKEWQGTVYPQPCKTKDYLFHYSRQFNTIELNTTHYRIPNLETIKKWYTESASDFHFCPKIPQSISHSRELGAGSGNILAFSESIQGLQEKLGHCFMQLPPYFGADRLPMIEQFLKRFPNHIPLSIEVRNESWFENEDSFESLAKLLESHNVATVITDVAGRRDVLHQRLTSDTAVIRFVGNDLVSSDFERIDAWIQRMKYWFENGIKRIYFFTHEPDNLKAPELADYLTKVAQQKLNVITRGPDLEKYNQNDQMSLF